MKVFMALSRHSITIVCADIHSKIVISDPQHSSHIAYGRSEPGYRQGTAVQGTISRPVIPLREDNHQQPRKGLPPAPALGPRMARGPAVRVVGVDGKTCSSDKKTPHLSSVSDRRVHCGHPGGDKVKWRSG